MIFKQGVRTTTSLTFWGCDDTDTGGVFGVLLDGVLNNGDTLISTNDYTGTVTVTVSKGNHTVQPTLDGATVGPVYACKTAPAKGEYVKVLFTGDANTGEVGLHTLAYKENDADAVLATEMEYIDSTQYSSSPMFAEPLDDIITDYTASSTADTQANAGQTIISPVSATGFAIGKYATMTLDDASLHVSRINNIGGAPGNLTIQTGIPTGRFLAVGGAIVQSERYTETTSGTYYDRFVASYRLKYRGTILSFGGLRRESYARTPWYTIWNNHEFDSDIFFIPKPGSAQYEAAAKVHWEHLSQHIPLNNDADADNTPNPGPFYFSHEIGDVQVIMCDHTAYADGSDGGALNGENNVDVPAEWQDRGENKQWAWAANKINTSTAKVVAFYLPSVIKSDIEMIDATNGICKLMSLRPDQTFIILTADTHRPNVLRHTIFGDNLLEMGCSPLDNSTMANWSTVTPEGTTTILWQDDVPTSTADYASGVLKAHEMNQVYVKLEYLPSGDAILPQEHVKFSMMRVTDNSVRQSVRLLIGQHNPVLEKRLPAAVTVY